VLASGTHLALFILASILISLVGVRVAAYVSGSDVEVGVEERRS
jgi:putative membrane protein